ncbi:NAD(P)/FAD-dependent oxidoreductase [Quadrisphaera sp. GCM10027208]|uniref:NAD(P)/FAD-dependent oxidoreductase n=1 Tax=Quadrisphaera sp. GCM10027208 TaxID=3273423 RepID=UPI00360D9FBA
MSRQTYVIVGGGLTAARAAQALRESGEDGDVVLVAEEPYRPYERPDLSKAFLAGEKDRDELAALDADWYDEHGVELRLGVTATHLDTATRQLRLSDGSPLGYDRLLLATGSTPNRLGVEGSRLRGVHYLRTVDDSEDLRDVLAQGGPLVIVGGGWIGLEVAAVARTRGVEVTVLEQGPVPLRRVLGDPMGGWFADLHRRHGVDVRTGARVARLRGDFDVEAVVTEDGEEIPARAVLAAVGVGPRSELALSAGLEVVDGIVTDGRLRTSDPYVWAAGDVANADNAWAGRRLRVEHWANAQDQGAFAGRSMAGAGEEWARPPFFFTDQYDVAMEYRGWVDPDEADLVVRGRPQDADFAAFWLVDGAVHAGMHVNRWGEADAVKRLVEDRVVVDVAALADEGTDLAAL